MEISRGYLVDSFNAVWYPLTSQFYYSDTKSNPINFRKVKTAFWLAFDHKVTKARDPTRMDHSELAHLSEPPKTDLLEMAEGEAAHTKSTYSD